MCLRVSYTFFLFKDIDECELGMCTHKCINTHGSYQCQCDVGLYLKYGHCIENYNAAESSVLFSDQNRIFKFNLLQITVNYYFQQMIFQWLILKYLILIMDLIKVCFFSVNIIQIQYSCMS